jgi:hypothetical protein
LQRSRDDSCAVEVAVAEAHAAGVPAYYMDESIGDAIVEHMPDGTIHLLDPNRDEDVVLRMIPPKCRNV